MIRARTRYVCRATRQPRTRSSRLRFSNRRSKIQLRPLTACIGFITGSKWAYHIIKKWIISQHHHRYLKAFDTSQNDDAPSNYRMEDKTNDAAYKRMQLIFFYITRKALTNKETAIFQSDPTASPHSFTLVHELLEAICKQFFYSPVRSHVWTASLTSSVSVCK